jgi:hypothetical protein
MPTVILSPHLDDAVLSCWHILTEPGEVIVINVFAGAPEGLDRPAWWDRYTGAVDSGDRVRERIEEDREALALAGRSAVNLDFLDEQYREREQPLAPITAAIEPLLMPGAEIYAPAALANHTDHALVRDAALDLRRTGFAVSLYADLPHAALHGWPAWVKNEPSPVVKDLAGAFWDRALAGAAALKPTVHALDPETHARKVAAVHMYETQVRALEEFVGRSLKDPEVLGYEVDWATASPARETGRAGRRR